MTEKKAAFGNNFTPEQRAAALKRNQAEMRGARAEYLDRVKSGEVAIATALADGAKPPSSGASRRSVCSWPCGCRRGEGAKRHDRNRHRGVPPRRGHRVVTGRKAHRTFSGRCARCVAPRGNEEPYARPWSRRPSGGGSFPFAFQGVWGADECFPFGKHERARGAVGAERADSIEGEYTRGAGGRPMKGSTAMWNHDAVDKRKRRHGLLYGEDATRTVEHGTEAETGELLVRKLRQRARFRPSGRRSISNATPGCAKPSRTARRPNSGFPARRWIPASSWTISRTVHQTHGRTRRQHVRRAMDRRNP